MVLTLIFYSMLFIRYQLRSIPRQQSRGTRENDTQKLRKKKKKWKKESRAASSLSPVASSFQEHRQRTVNNPGDSNRVPTRTIAQPTQSTANFLGSRLLPGTKAATRRWIGARSIVETTETRNFQHDRPSSPLPSLSILSFFFFIRRWSLRRPIKRDV